jgi:hypothetical protein
VLVCGAGELRWTSLQHGVDDTGAEVGRTELSMTRWGGGRMMHNGAAPVDTCRGGGVSQARHSTELLNEARWG